MTLGTHSWPLESIHGPTNPFIPNGTLGMEIIHDPWNPFSPLGTHSWLLEPIHTILGARS